MAETPNELLTEIREVLGPLLCGLSDDNPAEALLFVAEELRGYQDRIAAWKWSWIMMETSNDRDTTE